MSENGQDVPEVADVKPARRSFKANSTRLIDLTRIQQNVIPDIKDNRPSVSGPEMAAFEGDTAALAERFLPLESRKELVEKAIANLAVGESRGIIVIAGNKETCTAHPHLFEITRNAGDIELLFVDPEDTIGQNHLFRPRIAELASAQIATGGNFDMSFAMNRFRTPGIEPKQLHLPELYSEASELMNKKGMPDMLSGKENEITFRIFWDGKSAQMQSRYTSTQEAARFLQGGKGSHAAEGKVVANARRLGQFLAILDTPDKFKSVFNMDQQQAIMNFDRIRHKFVSTKNTVSAA